MATKARAAQNKQVETYRKLLLEKQKELIKSQDVRVAEDGDIPLPGDAADQASKDAERQVKDRLRQTNFRLLRAIEEALERIKRGTFGVCGECGEPISPARLKAVPWTRLCLSCKDQRPL